MEKQEIIHYLQSLLQEYSNVLMCENYKELLSKCREFDIQLGFCYKLRNEAYWFTIMYELKKDCKKLAYRNYWYPVVADCEHHVDTSILNCIHPRIYNIERTITRLQTELQTSNN
ncbi:hypothetical protein V1389_02085 [Flavobacterium rakeshii]|uniref:hypothetical protein n=1 Tax=Flavobacterium rakeshii TaxID=1038845 RepID=UPI002E7B63D5|nr:hypothetical protein [Flavobacterium rakeshii]MEE1897106.1 hypothetical protein [Flavobacterium rakeshii]